MYHEIFILIIKPKESQDSEEGMTGKNLFKIERYNKQHNNIILYNYQIVLCHREIFSSSFFVLVLFKNSGKMLRMT